ncbi:MFS transporter [Isoalcanivorax indicus]|uniref:MFS transporter n=1 Tax=Isoalcanivorax indicus TaxID=2202653 RepID=UPI001FE7E505|nr:MFS transporter [Isoalcanivorax indicus]
MTELAARRTQAMLLTAVAVTGMGQTLVFAILPSLGRAAGIADIKVGLIISCSSLMFALASPVWGRTSEYLGRKPVLVIGLAGYALGTALFATAFWFGIRGVMTGMLLVTALIASRVLQASIMAATPPAAAAYMADTSSPATRTKAMGRIGAAHNLGTVVGPAVGGLIAGISLVAPLYMVAVITALMALWVWRALPESPYILQRGRPAAPFSLGNTLRSSFTAYTDRRLTDILLVGLMLFVAFAIVQQTLGFLFQDRLAMSPQQAAGGVGIAMMCAALTSLLAQAVIVQRLGWSPEAILRLAVPLMGTGVLLLLWAPDQVWVTVSVMLLGLGLGLGMPGVSSAASLRVGVEEQGAVAGLMSACPALGFIFGPVIGTGLYQLQPNWPYLLVLVLFVPLMWAVWRLRSQ